VGLLYDEEALPAYIAEQEGLFQKDGVTAQLMPYRILVFQILVTARDAAKKVNPNSIDSIMSLRARPMDVYWHECLPVSS
jgi:ABC-type nitrate/sulfonate/bicarbonate transport system permease component